MFLTRLYIMYRVIEALVYRETKTRFGQQKLGYLWVFLEPISQIAVFTAIFGVFMGRVMPGVDYIVYLTIGVVGWNLFNDTLNQSLTAVKSNQGLLIYNRVKPIDTVLSRAVLEGVIFWLILPTILLFLHILGRIYIYWIYIFMVVVGWVGNVFWCIGCYQRRSKMDYQCDFKTIVFYVWCNVFSIKLARWVSGVSLLQSIDSCLSNSKKRIYRKLYEFIFGYTLFGIMLFSFCFTRSSCFCFSRT